MAAQNGTVLNACDPPREGLFLAFKYEETEAQRGDITCTGWPCGHDRTQMQSRCTQVPAARSPRRTTGWALKAEFALSTRGPASFRPQLLWHLYLCPPGGIW